MDAQVAASKASRVADWMQRYFVAIAPTETIGDAREMMRLARVRHLLVVEDGILVGLVSYRDLLESQLLAALAGEARASVAAAAEDEPVATRMVPAPVTIGPATTLGEAAGCMLRLHLGCLPVVETAAGAPRLVGLVTESDLLRAAYVARPRAG